MPRPAPGRIWGLALAAAALAAAPAAAAQGVIPTGLWVLNLSRSQPLEKPASQVLWVVKDDGRQLAWAVAITDAEGRVRLNSWEGAYGGPPSPVSGTQMTSQVAAGAPGALRNFGQIAGVGPYSEDCQVSDGGRRFVCHGEVQMADGPHRWLEDYDWAGPTPR